MRREGPRALNQLFLFPLQQIIRHAPFPIPVHQLIQRPPRFALQKSWREIER